MILVTVVTDGSPSMTLLIVVIFGSPSITTSFTTGLVSISLYSVITWPSFTTCVPTFGPVSITWVLITLISGTRTRRQRFKKRFIMLYLIKAIFTSATCTQKGHLGGLHYSVFCVEARMTLNSFIGEWELHTVPYLEIKISLFI